MDCQEIKELLVPYLESDLSANEKAIVEAHLRTCGACQKEKMLLEKSWGLLEGVKVPQVSPDFTDKLMAKIHTQGQERPSVTVQSTAASVKVVFWILGIAIVYVCLLCGVYLYVQNKPAPEVQTVPVPIKENVSEEVVVQPVEIKKVIPRSTVNDDEIIRHLDVYENIELYKNFNVLKNYELIENLNAKAIAI